MYIKLANKKLYNFILTQKVNSDIFFYKNNFSYNKNLTIISF